MPLRLILIIGLAIAAVAALAFYALSIADSSPEEVLVQEKVLQHEFAIEIADSPAEREQGLSNRKEVPGDYGLLFIFPAAGSYGFWMKDMLVSIDIIWLSDDGTVIGIEEAISPETYPTVYQAPTPVRYVLETRAGEARTQGWSVGKVIPLAL